MELVHQAGSVTVLAAIVAVGIYATASAWLGRWYGAAPVLAYAMTGLSLLQAGAGLLVWAGGTQPREMLHLLYGAALAAIMPLALVFASDAPPRPRSGVVAVASLVAAVIWWRLLVTG